MAFLTPVPCVPVSHRQLSVRACPQVTTRVARHVSTTMTVSAPAVKKKYVLEKLRKLDYGRAVAKDVNAQNRLDADLQELEKLNSSVEPVTDERLNGTWRLVYTTSKGILGLTRPKPFRPNIVMQTIDIENMQVRNKERIELGPFCIDTAVEAEIIDAAGNRVTVQFIKFIFFGFISINVRDNNSFIGWQEVTYLDEDLRVSRGNEGNLFVLEKVE